MSQLPELPGESWEIADASAYFPTEGRAEDRLHVNKLTQVDQKDMEYVPDAGGGELQGGDHDGRPQDGDSYTDGDPDAGHVDDAFEMDGLEGGFPDDRELKADRTEDERSEDGDGDDGERGDSVDEGTEAETEQEAPAKPKPEPDPVKPVQKDPEGVQEVAEATSQTSEDVHGGDEATKDIEDSPNAADNGENADNQGASSGEDGEDGADPSGNLQPGDEDAGGGTIDEPLMQEDWERRAEQSAEDSVREQAIREWQSTRRPEDANGGGAKVDYRSFQKMDVTSLRAVFHKVRELVRRLLSDEDLTQKSLGGSRWWGEEVVRRAMGFQHHLLPSARYEHPVKNRLVFFVDVSGSVQSLAELFMSLMGGAAGLPGVKIVVGSEAHAENEIVVERPFADVETAIEFFRSSINGHVCDDPLCPTCKGKIRNTGWQRAYESPFEPAVIQYLRDHDMFDGNTTCIFFGDMQGVHFNLPELRTIVRTCRCLWLFTDEPGHYTHTGDLPIALRAGMPIAYNIRNATRFVRAVRRIRDIRPGLQIL